MKKIELEIETYKYQLEEYLLSIDGITDVKKEEKGYNFFITVTYDERKIFIERIENFIYIKWIFFMYIYYFHYIFFNKSFKHCNF